MNNEVFVVEPEDYKKIKKSEYKRVCRKIGLSILIYFICRILCGVITNFAYIALSDLGITALYAVSTALSCVFVYFIPLLTTIIIFNTEDTYSGNIKALYKRPEKSARVFGAFPAVYGLGQAVNLLTLLAFFIISKLADGYIGEEAEKIFQSGGQTIPENMTCALIMTFTAVIIAPLIEEFWLRGIFYDALKPFGNGIAILITSVIFGLMHSNPQMLFYTTALGLALGYVRYATGSVFATTVMHAGINLISMILMLFMSSDTFKEMSITGEQSSADELLTVMYYIYLGAVLIMMVIGLISFFKKLPGIRRNKIENPWTDVKPAKKLAVFLFSVPVLAMLVLAYDAHFGQRITRGILELFLS